MHLWATSLLESVQLYIFAAMTKKEDPNLLKKIIAHAKEYGFVFPSSEIYDGLTRKARLIPAPRGPKVS